MKIGLMPVFLLLIQFVLAQPNTVTKIGNGDTSSINSLYREGTTSHSITFSDSVTYHGRKSLRIELDKNDPIIGNNKRAELTKMIADTNQWYGIRMYFPKGYTKDPEPEIVSQWHDKADSGEIDYRSPPIALVVKNDTFYLDVRFDTSVITNNLNFVNTKNRKLFNLGIVKKETWIDWVFHINESFNASGLLEVYQNGNKLLEYKGPNWYNDKSYGYFKFGIYKWVWGPTWKNSKSTVSRRVLYFDDVMIYNKNFQISALYPKIK